MSRFVTAGFGLLLILAGVVVSLTFVGALVGIPLILMGVLLVRRGLLRFV